MRLPLKGVLWDAIIPGYRRTRRLGGLTLISLAAAMLTLAACGGSESATATPTTTSGSGAETPGEPKTGGTLKVTVIGSESSSLDPAMTLGTVDMVTTAAAYDNLVMIQPDLTVQPMLAESWENSDDLTSYTFHLRQGVKFHHGKEFKAEDVIHSFKRLLDPELDSPARTTVDIIESMVADDDYTVRFELKSPSAFFPEVLSIYQARIVPSDVDSSQLVTQDFGTGPFMVEEFLPGERITLSRNPDYWDEGKPYLNGVEILFISEPATRASALTSGDLDLIFLMQHQNAATVDANPNTVVLETASGSYLNLAMDNRVAPFDNVLVRKAIQAATDRQAINQAALLGRGIIANDHPIPPSDPHFAQQYAPPAYDPELAKSLLEQAGYPNGLDLTLYTSTAGTGMVEMAVAFKERAAAADIRVDVQQVSEDNYWASVWMQEPFTSVFWNGRLPDQALSIVYKSDAAWNESFWNNPRVDELIAEARGETELADRRETYGEIQEILVDQAPRIIPVFQPVLLGARNEVRGVKPHPLGWLILNEAWLDR